MGRFGLSAGSTRHAHGRWHGRFAISLGLSALTAMLLGVAADPQLAQAAPGTITGHVTDGSSNNLQGVFVTARNLNGSSSTDTTDSSGNYMIADLPTGPYIVHFEASGVVGDFATEYYDGKPTFGSADRVSVTDGQTTSNIDASLAAGATITGHVTDDSNAAIEGVCVEVLAPDGEEEFSSRTDLAGNYSIPHVAAGSWTLYFDAEPDFCVSSGNFASEYYNDKPDFDSADPVVVTAGTTISNINASLASLNDLSVQLAGLGSGTVTSSPAGIDCGVTCSAQFNDGAQVILTASAASGSAFTGWSGGGCLGTDTCMVTINADTAVTASFSPKPPNTKISGVKIDQAHGSATFEFELVGGVTAKASSGFQCALLKKKHAKPRFNACKSPKKYKHLKPHGYIFEVRGFNANGKDPTPAKKNFRIRG
ncbi:MAG: hypothetical protein QOJ01_617 [Solirubrobacterales bacterium]|nr:hypothetical protein [Solirubrobacterales bacterium]